MEQPKATLLKETLKTVNPVENIYCILHSITTSIQLHYIHIKAENLPGL